MATFADMFNTAGTKLDTAFNNPFMQLGLQMLAQSGPQQGNPGFGQRFGAAGLGFMDQRAQAAEAQYKQQMRQAQMAQMQREEAQRQADAATRKQLQEQVRANPSLLANNPIARAVLEGTGDYGALGDLSKYGPPKDTAPKAPWQYEQFTPTGEAVQYTYDPGTGGYTAGQPFRPTKQQAIDVQAAQVGQARQRWETEQQFKERQQNELQQYRGAQLGQKAAETGARGARVEVAAAAEQRKMDAEDLKRKLEQKKIESQYKAATNQIDDKITQLKTLRDHPGLAGNYGWYGMVPNPPNSDAADAQRLIEKAKAGLGLSELVRLEQQGIKLTPVSNTDLAIAEKSAANLDNLQSVEQAQSEIDNVIRILERSKQEAATNFGQVSALYGGQQPEQPAAPPTADDVMTAADIEATMQETGWSREEVTRRAQAKGIKVGN